MCNKLFIILYFLGVLLYFLLLYIYIYIASGFPRVNTNGIHNKYIMASLPRTITRLFCSKAYPLHQSDMFSCNRSNIRN
jgi:hypothetical protein